MAEVSRLLFHNAKIWNSGHADNTWMIIDPEGGTVVDIGVSDPPTNAFPEECTRDCEQRRVLPGIHDSHLHVTDVGDAINTVDVQKVQSIQELQGKVAAFTAECGDTRCVRGQGWEQDVLGRYPDRADIDAVVSDTPVRIYRICGHIAVVNSKTLELAGITRDTEPPFGGSIDKYPEGHSQEGEPSGILREKALDLVAQLFTPTHEETLKNITCGLQKCLESGTTSVHTNEPAIWQQYCELADQDKLPIRVFFCCYYAERDAEGFPTPRETHGPYLSCDRIKLFTDGALGSSTAAISEHYVGTQHKGMLIYTQDELDSLVSEANSQGFRLEIHVIGDVAAEAALKAIEKAKVPKERRPILTHCQILRLDLIEKMKELGVVANIQPQFVTKDSTWLTKRIPRKLLKAAYVWKSLIKEGIPCAGGSDAPTEEPNPFWGMYDAIFRPVGKRFPTPDIFKMMRPEECLSIQEAIDLYTKGGAFATMAEDRLGELKTGFQADFVILHNDTDVCKHPAELLYAEPEEVWVMAQQKYKRTSTTNK